MQKTINMTEKILAWLADHPAISINKIEQEARLPASTIGQAKNGRGIPEKHIATLVAVLKKYGFK